MKIVFVILAIVVVLFLGIKNYTLIKKVNDLKEKEDELDALQKDFKALRAEKESVVAEKESVVAELKAFKESIVELRDKKPSGKSTKTSRAMKLSNELEPYIKDDGDEIVINVVKL